MAKDVYITILPPSQVVNLETFAFGVDSRAGMAGFYKTIMQWLKCFFTEVGSDPADLSYGTTFASYIGGGTMSENDLRDAAALSVRAATARIQAYQTGQGVPDDERLVSVTITGLNTSADGADLYVTFVNGEGTSLQLAVPAKTPSFKF